MKWRHISAHSQRFNVVLILIIIYQPRLPTTTCVVNSYASELQTFNNEPICNGNSYFIL